MMRAVVLALPLVLLALPGCLVLVDEEGDADPAEETPAGPQVRDIGMHNAMFDPDHVTATRGDTLRFAAHDTKHSVESTNGVYDAGHVPRGTSKDVLLNLAGNYVFRCNLHPGMEMLVTVEA